MRATMRLGASICLSVFSLVSVVLLLPDSELSTHLQKITLGMPLEDLPPLWNWSPTQDGDSFGGPRRLVVFGDSWVDDSDDNDKKGRSWAEVLCKEINCTTHLNYAVSQAIESYPSNPPTGAMTSNAIYTSSLASSHSLPLGSSADELLPDLAAQIQQFIALPQSSESEETTLFLLSFGFWDIYNLAGLEYGLGQKIINKTVDEMFDQLNILHLHYGQSLYAAHMMDDSATNTTEAGPPHLSPFRVIIPKIFEPTLLPGWISQRPVPLTPSSVAEDQKNAVHLASRWNALVGEMITGWTKEAPASPMEINDIDIAELASSPITQRDVLHYDLAPYLLDIIVEHQLESQGLSDATGLGKGNSSFQSVSEPCVREAHDGVVEGLDLNGMMVCEEPGEYLFWDNFNLGSVAKEALGKAVGKLIKQGKSRRKSWI